MPAIKPKQTEQNASLGFIMETDFDLFAFLFDSDFDGEAEKMPKMEQQKRIGIN